MQSSISLGLSGNMDTDKEPALMLSAYVEVIWRVPSEDPSWGKGLDFGLNFTISLCHLPY